MKYNARYNCYVSENGVVCKYDTKSDKLKFITQSAIGHNKMYRRVNLIDSQDNKCYSIRVHRLVYMTFMGEIPEGMQIDHIDGNASNNSLNNLRCVTPKENSNNPNTIWKLKGENNGMYGRTHSIESRRKMSESRKGKLKGIPKENSRWAKYGLSRSAIESKLKLSRKEVEMLDIENKLMEVIHVII